MIYKLEIDSSNEYDSYKGEYITIEEQIINLLNSFKSNGFGIYEYIVRRKTTSNHIISIPLKGKIFGEEYLQFFEKNIEDYSYEISAVNKLILTKRNLTEVLSNNKIFTTKDNLEIELISIFDIHIEIVESAFISLSTMDSSLIKELLEFV